MKRTYNIIIGALCGLIGVSSCADFLEIEPQNEIILEKFWNEKADVDGIITGCYSAMQKEGCIKRMIVWGEVRSDNVGVGRNISSDGSLEKVLKENIDAKNTYTTWKDFYSVINRCNTVIKYAPGVAAVDPAYTESELQANIAEVVALRSLCYFYLIRAFRDVPYSSVAFTDDDQTMDLPATKFDDVLDSLIVSLEEVKGMAVKRYPVTKPLYQTGRITQDAIYAMLCEMYLWKKDYQNCIKYADLVIDSKKKIAEENRQSQNSKSSMSTANDMDTRFNGYPLVSNLITSGYYGESYEVLFGADNRNSDDMNQEIIFQLVFNDSPSANSMPANAAINSFYGNANSSVGLLAPTDFIFDDIEKTSSRSVFADRNKKLDARMYINCNVDEKSIHKYTTRQIEINATSTTPTIYYYSLYSQDQNGSNWVIYRLTDIMLLKAEALSQMLREGADTETVEYNRPILAQAFSLVNAVNKRSVCQNQLVDTLQQSDYGTKSLMENLVLQERQRELMFEGKRWFDLVRYCQRNGNTQILSSAAMRKVTTGGDLIANKLAKMDAIYWPYNNDEIKINKNLKQNPAFSSGEDESYEKTK